MAMGTGASSSSHRGHRDRNRPGRPLRGARRQRVGRIELEGLEARTLLSTLPAATNDAALQQLTNFVDVTKQGNANSPTVVVNPNNSQDVVAIWGVNLSPVVPPVPDTTAIIEGAYSTNGGLPYVNPVTGAQQSSWVSFNPIRPIIDAATIGASPPTDYTQVTDPSVAFDGQGNFYVLALQTSGATDGALTLSKYNFGASSAPQQTFKDQVVYQWLTTSDAAYSPTLSVNAAPITPPAGVPKDPHAGNVYIAWASGDIAPANPNVDQPFNPNRIEMVVSADGGNTFSGETIVNTGPANGNIGPQDNSHPQLVINQNGTPFTGTLTVGSAVVTGLSTTAGLTVGAEVIGTGVPTGTTIASIDTAASSLKLSANATSDGLQSLAANPGQVTVGWEDFGSGATATPPFTRVMSNTVQAGDSYGISGSTGPIAPGTSGSNSDVPVMTPFTATVSVPDPAAITGLTITLDMYHPAVQDLRIVLVAPSGASITLLQNQTDAAGNNNTGRGLNGTDLGIFGANFGTPINPGVSIGTVFDDNATRSIFDPTATGTNGVSTPAVGHYRPENGSLASLLASGSVNGTWTLQITDYRADASTATPPHPSELTNFHLQFTTGMTRGTPTTLSRLAVAGSLTDTYPTAAPSTPNGVGPGLVMAIDNTLGTGSPYQGRIYAAFVGYLYIDYPSGVWNPTTNTDIFLMHSDDGGQTCKRAGRG